MSDVLDSKNDFQYAFNEIVQNECGTWNRNGIDYGVYPEHFEDLNIQFVDTNAPDGHYVDSGLLGARIYVPYTNEEKQDIHYENVQKNYQILDEAREKVGERFASIALENELEHSYGNGSNYNNVYPNVDYVRNNRTKHSQRKNHSNGFKFWQIYTGSFIISFILIYFVLFDYASFLGVFITSLFLGLIVSGLLYLSGINQGISK